jgi:hypothetical protein
MEERGQVGYREGRSIGGQAIYALTRGKEEHVLDSRWCDRSFVLQMKGIICG